MGVDGGSTPAMAARVDRLLQPERIEGLVGGRSCVYGVDRKLQPVEVLAS